MNIQRAFSLLLAAAAVCGCAPTPYKAFGSKGGYEDRAIAEDKFWVRFTGNQFTGQDAVKGYWKRRASELCSGREYTSRTVVGTEGRGGAIVMGTGAYYAETVRFPVMEGTVECQSTNVSELKDEASGVTPQ